MGPGSRPTVGPSLYLFVQKHSRQLKISLECSVSSCSLVSIQNAQLHLCSDQLPWQHTQLQSSCTCAMVSFPGSLCSFSLVSALLRLSAACQDCIVTSVLAAQ